MMNASTAAAAIGFALVMLLVPIVIRLCVRWKLYDWPGPLKLHAQPIPRLGGVAVTIAISGGVLSSIRPSTAGEFPLFAALALICVIGVVDDVYGLPPAPRLAAQVAAGGILWYSGGRSSILGSGVFGLVAACFLVVIIVNSLNFLDGSDGLASGVAGIIALVYAALFRPAENPLAAAVAWSLAGSCGAFLLFNFPPAKIFLGDSGSTVVGLGLAFLNLNFYRLPSAAGSGLLFPLVVAGLPLLDAALAAARRIASRASPFSGDRKHFYDLLLARGWSPHGVALVSYGLTAALGLFGYVGERTKPAEFFVVTVLGAGGLLVTAIRLGALQQRDRRGQQPRKALTEMNQ
jgi:UDP-GlcNAc:undecaprenyl-phosphate/decaprenyl-phosphate GlcNAc-1-phosphate transferase